MAIRIITDSAADYEQEELQQKQIICVPLTVSFDEEVFLDGEELSKAVFYNKLLSSGIFPKTAQPSPEAFLQCFEAAKAVNDTVIVILLSASISGTVQSATIAKGIADYQDIHIIDSRAAAICQRLLVDTAVKMREEGCSGTEIVRHIEALVPKLKLVAMVDTLEYLHQGGRLTKTQAKIGSLANLKPLVTFHEDGRLVLFDKCLGKNRAFKKLLASFDMEKVDKNYPVYFTYSNSSDNCEKFIKMVKERYPEIDEKQMYGIGPTIGTHTGDGVVGFSYIAKV